MLDNAAHDSACACSADEVVDHVLVRYAEARQIGEGLAAEAVSALAGQVDAAPGSLLLVNPSQHLRRGTTRFDVAGTGPVHLLAPDGTALPAQVVGARQRVELTAETAGRDSGITTCR